MLAGDMRSSALYCATDRPPEPETFTNPIAPGSDPWVVWHDGFYYWCASENDRGVAVYRSDRLHARGEKQVVWCAPQAGPNSREVWAPELHRLDGRWYVYVTAANGRNETHRMIVLEAVSDDPMGEFRFKAELYTGDDVVTGRENRWAVDGTVLDHRGQRYLLWSGWKDERDQQWLYIARLSNPWTVSSNRVRMCANNDFAWEHVDESRATRGLNEAPQVLKRNGRIFVVFSASASWETSYKLGLLELTPGADPLDARAWRKYHRPALQATPSTRGVGHCSFTCSPDGKEDWMVFHVKQETTPNGNRAVHAQRFTWDEAGVPVFGEPVAASVAVVCPSGSVRPVVTGEVAFGRAALMAAGDRAIIKSVRIVET